MQTLKWFGTYIHLSIRHWIYIVKPISLCDSSDLTFFGRCLKVNVHSLMMIFTYQQLNIKQEEAVVCTCIVRSDGIFDYSVGGGGNALLYWLPIYLPVEVFSGMNFDYNCITIIVVRKETVLLICFIFKATISTSFFWGC